MVTLSGTLLAKNDNTCDRGSEIRFTNPSLTESLSSVLQMGCTNYSYSCSGRVLLTTSSSLVSQATKASSSTISSNQNLLAFSSTFSDKHNVSRHTPTVALLAASEATLSFSSSQGSKVTLTPTILTNATTTYSLPLSPLSRLSSNIRLGANSNNFNGNTQTNSNCPFLRPGDGLDTNRELWNYYGSMRLQMQNDGNLVIYKCLDQGWAGTNCIANIPIWASNTWGPDNTGYYFRLTLSCDLIIYDSSGTEIWGQSPDKICSSTDIDFTQLILQSGTSNPYKILYMTS